MFAGDTDEAKFRRTVTDPFRMEGGSLDPPTIRSRQIGARFRIVA